MGRAGRYGTLPGAERLIPVVRQEQQLPGGGVGELLALDAVEVGERVPLRADLRGGRAMRDLFAPLAASDRATRPGSGAAGAPAAPGGPGITLPGSPHRIDVDVAVRSSGTGWAAVSLLLRDRFGTVHATPPATLPESGEATLPFALDPLTGAPIGSAATPLTLAGVRLSYAGDGGPAGEGGELTLRRIAVSDTPGGAAVPVTTTGTPAWQSAPPQGGPRNLQAPALSPVPPGSTDVLRVRYWGGFGTDKGVRAVLFPTPATPPATAVPAVATTGYLRAIGASVGQTVNVTLDGTAVPVRITAAVDSLPVVGRTALAVDLRTIGRFLLESASTSSPPPPPSGGCPQPRPPTRHRAARRPSCVRAPVPSASNCARRSPPVCWTTR